MKTPNKSDDKKADNDNAPKTKTETVEVTGQVKDDASTDDGPINHIEGEHIEQKKKTMEEGFATSGPNATVSDVGEGSITEEAPAVRGTATEVADGRIVQQGDEVVVHTRSPINGLTENHGIVLKVNQDSTIAVRVPRADGNGAFDLSPVFNAPNNGEHYWTWAAKDVIDTDTDKA